MKINIQTGLIERVEYQPTPHCDARPRDAVIDMIIVHNISLPPNQFGGTAVERFFRGHLEQNEHPYYSEISHLKVAPHIYIKRTGEVIQFVPCHKRAWHAGQSVFEGQERCNDFSIGIELEGCDTEPYEAIQYEQLSALTNALMDAYPIKKQRIVGHADVAPGRKTDPGPMFDWQRYKGNLK